MPTERELAFMCVKYRRDNFLKVEECARQIGLSSTTYSRIEQEKKVTKTKFLQVYEFLKEKGVEL